MLVILSGGVRQSRIHMAERQSRETLNPTVAEKFEDPKHGGQRVYDSGRIADDGYIYTPYITLKSGKVIWHPTGGVFRFLPKEN